MDLNDRMTISHVVRVNVDGTISDSAPGIYAPEVNIDYDGPFAEAQISKAQDADMVADLKGAGWTVEDGWSGQYLYSGPIMHASEYIGGALAEHILATPGYWVAESVEIHPGEDDPEHEDNGGNGESEAAGWIVMHRPFPPEHFRFAVTTGTGMRALVVYDPDERTVQVYDRQHAGQPGFTEHGQMCGGPQFASDFRRDATTGIRGWSDADYWDLNAHTVRLIGTWLHVSGFTTEEN